jgi:RNA polymerase sigma-70 factor, ECF subfamily
VGPSVAALDGGGVPVRWQRPPAAPLPLDTREGFRVFYDAALPEVFAFLMRKCRGDRSLAEDLTQETFLAAARQVREGNASTLSVPWLMTVAQNRFVDHLRRQQRDERNLLLAWQNGEHDAVHAWQLQRHRESARDELADLPPLQRAALVLFYLEDLTVAQTASRLGKSVRATESLLARGREALRKRLAEEARDA